MHDLDRTQLEQEQYEAQYEDEGEQFLGNLVGGLFGGEMESPLDEIQESELATELLEVTNEEELDRFLGRLVGGAAKAAGQFLRSDTGRQLTGILKNAARQALPVVGGALGGAIGGTPGKSIGSRFASDVGKVFGLELEGLSAEDRELEVARQFVRFGSVAARTAPAFQGRYGASRAARAAAIEAARAYAPGLVPHLGGGGPPAANGSPYRRSGRWVRKGRAIVLYGV